MPEQFLRLTLLLTTVSIFISVYIGVSLILRREPSLDDKLRKFTAWRAPVPPGRNSKSLKELLSTLGRWAPRSWTERLDQELVRAGIPLKGGEMLVLEGFLVFIGAGLGLVLTSKGYAGVVAGSLGLILPRVWLHSAQKRKRKSFSNQLADALLILANSLKAGFSLLQAMEMVSREMPDPIAAEFQITLREMSYGTPTEEALLHLSERVGSEDLDLLVTAILIQRQVGGNLAEVLLNIHTTIQDRIRIQQEVKTLTAQGRTSGYIIAGLPFAIAGILMVINPGYLKLLVTEPLGLAMLGGGLVSQIIGFIVIRRIISIEV